MFNRIRYAAAVLSSSSPNNPYERSDIAFEEEKAPEVSRVSRFIGVVIEVLVITFGIGVFVAPAVARLWPARTVANVSTTAAVVAALLTFFSVQLFERFKVKLGAHLKIGEKVAPYFGHRITHAVKIIRN